MNWIIISIGFLGFVPLLIVLWKRRSVRKLKQSGERVTGIVEQVEERIGFKGARYFQAVIRYPIGSGNIYRGVYTFSASKRLSLFTTGQPLDVYFDRDKPQKFIPADLPQSPAALILTIIVAIAYIVICFCLYDTIYQGRD